jgi:exodeoxyribonuclease-3
VLSIATVNVNGIRAAFRRGMGEWLARRDPDVLALQEVRAGDHLLTAHLGPGWHVAHEAGEVKGRAGVAVATRLPLTGVRVGLGPPAARTAVDSSGRWVEADVALPGGASLTVTSVYVHKGEAGSERMASKYAFLDAVTARMGELASGGGAAVVAGDLNIAHTARDLRNWRGNAGRAGFLPQEREYLDRWLAGGAWVDVARRLAGDVPGPYTWWSWRGRAYDADAGWRIDYQLATAPLADAARAAAVDRAPSYAERFSDHAPLVVTYDVAMRRGTPSGR